MTEEELLRCLLHVIGRSVITPEEVRASIGKGKNRVKAFNLFDGNHTLQEVASKTRIDRGNLSRTAGNWVNSGIAFWVGEGANSRLLHLYPIPEKAPRDAE
jgi:hypothetical protein